MHSIQGVCTISATDHIGHIPHWPHKKNISATMNNHIGHMKIYCYSAPAFKSYTFETQNVVSAIPSHVSGE